MKFSCKVFVVYLVYHFMPHLREGSADIIGKVIVNFGDTANLFYHSVNESSENFRGYRVKKNNETFRALPKGSDTSQCIDGHLKDLCNRTEFKRQNGSHLLLKIKDTVVDDSGKYSVHRVFKALNNDTSEEIVLEVTDLDVKEKPTNISPTPSEEQDKTPGSSEATRTSTTASRTPGSASAPASVLLLMFAIMCVMISI